MNQRLRELMLEAGYAAPELAGRAQKLSELIIRDYAKQLVQANMSDPEYVRAMDAYYEEKWAHRFD